MPDAHQYHLATGEAGEAQLDNLDLFFGQHSRQFLTDVGVKAGMQIADVGCGVANLSFWLAEKVGKNGHVYAIDNDPAQLDVAKRRAKTKNITNISFHHHDVLALPTEFNHKFDLTYCRWLLVHVQNPELAIQNMANTVNANGSLAFEIGDMRQNGIYPPFAPELLFWQKTTELLAASGNDINIAYNAAGICKRLANFKVTARTAQPLIIDQQQVASFCKKMPILIDSMSPSLIKHGLLTKEKLAEIKQHIIEHPVDENTMVFFSRMVQLHCQKQ